MTIQAYLTAFCGNLVSAALRLAPIGQSDGIAALAALEPTITVQVERLRATPFETVGAASLMIDWCSMSAYADQPDHFVQWLRRLPKATQALLNEYPTVTTFVPRGLYGSYIQQQLGEEIWRRGHADGGIGIEHLLGADHLHLDRIGIKLQLVDRDVLDRVIGPLQGVEIPLPVLEKQGALRTRARDC